MNVKRDIFDKYLDTKNKKIIAGCSTVAIVLASTFGVYALTRDTAPKFDIIKNNYVIEYGETFNTDFDNLVSTKGLDKEEKDYLKKAVKIDSTIKNEDAKEYPSVGDYKIVVQYKDIKESIKVIVKDTKAPELTVPENIEILQGTDLANFDFKSLITATDLAQMNEVQIDYSSIDINVPAEYIIKASVEDVNANKSEKEFKVTVIIPPAVSDDEVVVQEEITNPDGTKTVKNTVKKKTDAVANGNKVVSNNTNSSSNNTSTGGGNTNGSISGGSSSGSTSGSGNGSISKPSDSTGSNTGGSTSGSTSGNNSGSTGGNTSGGNNGSDTGSSGSGSTGGNNEKPSEPVKRKVWRTITYKWGDSTIEAGYVCYEGDPLEDWRVPSDAVNVKYWDVYI